MVERWYKKGLVFGIIILFIGAGMVPGISSKTVKPDSDKIINHETSKVEDEFATLTFNTFNENGKKENKIELPSTEAKYIFNLFENLKNKTISHPNSQETLDLKNEFIELLLENSLIPSGMSKTDIQPLINPHGNPNNPKTRGKTDFLGLIFELLFSNRFNHLRLLESLDYPSESDWNIVCNIASGGTGIPLPLFLIPRPRAIVLWGASAATTATGSLLIPKSFIAMGSQQGIALGFMGVGLTIAFAGFMAYGMLGYALYTAIQAEFINRYNIAPSITNENPASGSDNVPINLGELSFRITDDDGDLMSYTVTTNPDIGSGSGSNKINGVYSVPIGGLDGNTDYTWHVTVDDGYETVEKHFTFKTEANAPIISDPNPSDGDLWVPVDISQLSFKLRDFQGDPMDYTVETVPNIGSGNGYNVGDGTYTLDVSDLDLTTEYIWYVNVTDGEHWTHKIYNFKTQPIMVFDPFDEGWMYRKKITIDHNLVDGNLIDFPVLISTTDSDLRDKAQNDGDDILFMNGQGTAYRLAHEIEKYDESTGELIAWVNIPNLSPSADTYFYMYYGNPDCSNQQYPEQVWDSNYVAVYHMDETSGNLKDSTGNGYDGIFQGDLPSRTTCKIGYGQYFDGSSDYITLPAGTYIATSATVSLWQKEDDNDAIHPIYSCAEIAGDDSVHKMLPYQNHNADDIEYGYMKEGAWVWDKVDDNSRTTDEGFYAHMFDGLSSQLWKNAGVVSTGGVGTSGKVFTPTLFYIGSSRNLAVYYLGWMDEFRVSDIARSDTWMITSYNTMNDPSSFYNIDPEESAP